MQHVGPTVGKASTVPLQSMISHRKLVATTFPDHVTAEMRDHRGLAIEDQEEIFHCVASQGMLLYVLALLRDGVFSCDTPDRFGRTPLHWAAEQGHRNVVLVLLRAEACVDPRSQRSVTPIMLAASRGHEAVIEVLLQFRAGESDRSRLNHRRNGVDHWRSTALHCAAAGGHIRTVGALLEAGFDWGQQDEAGLTPAEVSARAPQPKSLTIPHPPLPSSMGGRLLHAYVSRVVEDVDIVSGLVHGGAYLDWQDKAGDTPLHRAAHFSHADIVSILLHAGADPNIRSHCGASPLHVAAFAGCCEVVADLLEAGADTGLQTVSGDSPLHTAVMHNRVAVVRLMLNARAPMEQRDAIHGQTALSWACRVCPAPMVRELVEAGANVESRSSAGLTPLHLACRFNNAEGVEVLLNAGADPGAVDKVAADAVAASSYNCGTIISMPVAIDVVGLGYFSYSMGDSRYPLDGDLVRLGAGRTNTVAVKRIELALRGAKQQRSWRRRGWLVVLANRRAAVGNLGVRGEQRAAHRSCCNGPTISTSRFSRFVDPIVEHPPCAYQKAVTTEIVSLYPLHPPKERSDGPIVTMKKRRNMDCVMTMPRGAPQNVADTLPDLVSALFGLAAVEVGLFRRVVLYI